MDKLPLRNTEIAVVAIARDVGKTIEKDFRTISHAFNYFKQHWIIIESDSNDNSVETLTRLSRSFRNFTFKSAGNLQAEFPKRTQRLAYARNLYLKELKSKRLRKIEYVVVVDLNRLNKKLSFESVMSNWKQNNWAMVSANQSGKYYDLYALRHPFWLPVDPWHQHSFFREMGVFPEIALYQSIHSKMIKLNPNMPWIQVDSSFGGVAIYKRKYIKGAKYIGINSKNEQVCEHISFNKKVIKNGGSIYINPQFINCKYTDHSRNALWSRRILRLLSYVFKLKMTSRLKA